MRTHTQGFFFGIFHFSHGEKKIPSDYEEGKGNGHCTCHTIK